MLTDGTSPAGFRKPAWRRADDPSSSRPRRATIQFVRPRKRAVFPERFVLLAPGPACAQGIFGYRERAPTDGRCADVQVHSLHSPVAIPATDRTCRSQREAADRKSVV